MSIQNQIKEETIAAMKAKDSVKLNTLRSLSTAFVNELISKKKRPDEELPDEDALAVISRAVKQRKDSIEQFEKGGRADLAETEKQELAILEAYLPAQMSDEEIRAFVKQKQADPTTPEATRGNKNQFMGFVMKELKGKADGAAVKRIIEESF